MSFLPPVPTGLPVGFCTRTPLSGQSPLGSACFPSPPERDTPLSWLPSPPGINTNAEYAHGQPCPMSIIHRADNPRITRVLHINQEKRKLLELKECDSSPMTLIDREEIQDGELCCCLIPEQLPLAPPRALPQPHTGSHERGRSWAQAPCGGGRTPAPSRLDWELAHRLQEGSMG